jgi:hypothetical protein
MIHEVDETLRRFVRRDGLPGNEVELSFEAPTKEWSSRRTGPVVDLYLYDIREDLRRRQYGEIETRGDDGIVTARDAPPRWFKLSYLVTAWTQRPEDEHRLLSEMLGCFLLRDSLPRDLLVGSLADVGKIVPYTVALPPPQDRALSDVWSALGGELKPSLDLVLEAPFDLSRYLPVAPAVEAPLGIDMANLNNDGEDERRFPNRPRPDGTDGNGAGGSEDAEADAGIEAEPAPASRSAKAAEATEGAGATKAVKKRGRTIVT